MPGNSGFQELDPPWKLTALPWDGFRRWNFFSFWNRPFSGSTFVQFSGRVLVVMSNVLKIHSLPLQALAERLDHFDRVADVALGDLYTMWAAGNCITYYIFTYFVPSYSSLFVLFIHLLRCMLDHQSANGLLAAPTSVGTSHQIGLVRWKTAIGLKELQHWSKPGRYMAPWAPIVGIFTYMCFDFFEWM